MIWFQIYGTLCIRISIYAKSFTEARERCLAEGSDLAYIPNQDFADELAAMVDMKRQKYKYFDALDEAWIGGISSPDGSWSWLAYFQSFDAFSMWEFGNPASGTGAEGLVLMTQASYEWKAVEFPEPLPYICTYKCQQGYIWYKSLQLCVKVVPPGPFNVDAK